MNKSDKAKHLKGYILFTVLDFLLCGGVAWLFHVEDRIRVVLVLALLFLFIIFPLYAVIHGIFSYKLTERILLPHGIFLTAGLLLILCLPGFPWGIHTVRLFLQELLTCLLYYLLPLVAYIGISVALALLTQERLEKKRNGR